MKGFVSIEAIIVLIILVVSTSLTYNALTKLSGNPAELHRALWKRAASASFIALASGLSTNMSGSTFVVVDRLLGQTPFIQAADMRNKNYLRIWVDGLDGSDNLTVSITNETNRAQCNITPPYDGYGNAVAYEWGQGYGDSFADLVHECQVNVMNATLSIDADGQVFVLCLEAFE